jgi:peptidoglycan/xylan/chitin deacetylase (PgdA/CDA1 family)
MLIQRLLSKVRTRLRGRRPRPAILMYHRVATVRHDPWELAVPPVRFAEQIAYLSQHRTVLAMDDLVEEARRGTLPPDAVAITFDDGYRDNLVDALPVLQHYQVPATVFLATGLVDRNVPFWWDELAIMVLESEQPMKRIENCAGLEMTLDWGQQEDGDFAKDWRGWDAPRTSRQRAYVAIWSSLQRMSEADRDLAMTSLRQCLQTASDSLSKPMTTAEIGTLLSDGLVTLGGHSVTHASLTDVSRDESRREIRESGERCRILSTRPVKGFSYPFGNFNEEVCRDANAAGFSWACAADGGFLAEKTLNYFVLPRIGVSDMPLRRFARLLTI